MSHYFNLVSSKTEDLTPEIAAEFSVMPASVTERDLKPKRLEYLKNAVLGGTAVSFNWSRARTTATGDLYRVNGHHSSTVLAGLNGQFPDGLKVHIDDYEVADKDALALLFRQFDNRISSRTVDDIANAYQGLEPDLITVPRPAARKAVEGAVWYRKKIVGDDVPAGDDRFSWFNDLKLHPFIQMAGRVCSLKTPEFTLPVLGAMYGTYEREPAEAERFWLDVARQGDGNDVNHPTVVLDAWLVDGRERVGDKPREQEIYRACAVAWNAYRHHRPLEKIGKFDPKKGAPDLD